MEEPPPIGRDLGAIDASPAPPAIPIARPVRWPVGPAIPAIQHPFLLTGQARKSVWVDLGWLAVLLVTFEVVLVIVVRTTLRDSLRPDVAPDDLLVAQTRRWILPGVIAVRAGLAIFAVFLLCHRRGLTASSVGVERKRFLINTSVGVLTVVGVYGLLVACVPLAQRWPELLRQMEENTSRLIDLLPPLGPVGFIPVAALIGIYEEVIFRGFMLSRLRRGTGSWVVAVLAVTAVFTVLHATEQTAVALMVVAVLSIVFSVVTIWRRSIVPAIVAHALFDYTQFVFLYFQTRDSWR